MDVEEPKIGNNTVWQMVQASYCYGQSSCKFCLVTLGTLKLSPISMDNTYAKRLSFPFSSPPKYSLTWVQ